jgi:hypothetical protein
MRQGGPQHASCSILLQVRRAGARGCFWWRLQSGDPMFCPLHLYLPTTRGPVDMQLKDIRPRIVPGEVAA